MSSNENKTKSKPKYQNQNIKAATKQLILDFYDRDDISKVLPYKSKTVSVKTIFNTFQRKSIRVMELSLFPAFHQFKTEHPEFKVGKSTFQFLRPKNVRLKAAAKRLVCCCTYHQNIDYLPKTITRVLKFNKEYSDLFTSNDNLCNFRNFVNFVLINLNICKFNKFYIMFNIITDHNKMIVFYFVIYFA